MTLSVLRRSSPDQRGGIMRVELFHHRPAKSGLARADFTRELDETLALTNTVKDVIERLAMFRAVKEKAGIRRDVERRFRQAIVLAVHA